MRRPLNTPKTRRTHTYTHTPASGIRNCSNVIDFTDLTIARANVAAGATAGAAVATAADTAAGADEWRRRQRNEYLQPQ